MKPMNLHDTLLGACPSTSMGRAHGACAARSRREEGAMAGRIANDEERGDRPQPPCPYGFRRRAGIGGVAAPGPCAAAWPASRRLAAGGTALGTRAMLLLAHAPSRPSRQPATSSLRLMVTVSHAGRDAIPNRGPAD